MNQPVIVRLFVVLPAVLESVSKLCVAADPRVVRLTHCADAGRTPGRSRSRASTGNADRRRSRSIPDMGEVPLDVLDVKTAPGRLAAAVLS
jgi:hypothetical protein